MVNFHEDAISIEQHCQQLDSYLSDKLMGTKLHVIHLKKEDKIAVTFNICREASPPEFMIMKSYADQTGLDFFEDRFYGMEKISYHYLFKSKLPF